MTIGGRALSNGIKLSNDKVIVETVRDNNNKIVHKVQLVKVKDKDKSIIENIIIRIPILRGIYSFFGINKDKVLNICIILIFILDILGLTNSRENSVMSDTLSTFYKIFMLLMIGFALYVFIKLKKFLQYHGVEHKVVNAFEKNKSLTINEVKKCSRVHYRCGTIFAIFEVFVMVIIGYLNNNFDLNIFFSVQILLTIGLACEMFDNKFLYKIGFKYIFVLGGYIQKYLTTLEPTEEQLEVGIACLNKLLEVSKKNNKYIK